jgi:carboxypeptidase family protein/TonB-dependent receptor-like protein
MVYLLLAIVCRMTRILRNTSLSFLAGLFFLLGGNVAKAQFEDGSLVGTIHDASGASIPGATVSATNAGTGIVATTTSNSSGDYEFLSLRVGAYTVKAEANGFSTAVAENISVSVAARTRIDLSLKVGGSESTVEVTGVSLALETETSERGQNISNYQTEALPLVTRNYSDLLGLVTGSRQAPTAATTTAATSLVRQGSYNVNGQRSMFNNFLLDGMDNNAYGESNQGFDNQIIAPPPDSIAQFEVVTNNESAQYGRSSGATVNVASASGTNKFHSTLYEFIRNTDLNATGFFKPTQGKIPFVKPVFNRNQFGADFGGPILKDRFFFFLDYEGFRQTLKPLYVLTLPTQNQINGILTVPVQDPFTGTVYAAGTSILGSPDATAISKQVLGYFGQLGSILPLSGTAAAGGLVSNDYATTHVPFTDNSDKGSLRLDYQQNQTTSWFLRVSDRKETGINYPTIPLPLDGQTNGRAKIHDDQVAAGYTRTFGSNKVLEARLALSGTQAGKYSLSIGDNVFNIPGLPIDPTVAGGLPSISVSGGFTAFGRQSTNPQWQNPSLLDPKINYSWVMGHHSLKFGYEFEHIWMEVQDSNPLYGSFTFGKGYSTVPGNTTVADNYWADFIFGATNNYALATYFKAHLLQTMHNAYAQDDWHVTPKLTLNLGVRWEYGSPYSEVNNHLSNFDPTATSTSTAILTAKGGGVYNSTLVNPDLADWAPRVGFAYALTPKIAVRGGYGISYVHYTRAGSGDILAINAPNALFVSVTQPTSVTAPGYQQLFSPSGGFPTGLATNFNPATDNITYIPKDTRDSRVQSYFLSVQKQLAANTLVDVAYVGNTGARLQGFLNANQIINPGSNATRPYGFWPSDITEALNGFKSSYNALQARYEQRFVGGLTLLNSFTWSHALDNASASLEGNTPSPQDGTNINADYAQSDYNLPLANVTSLVYDLPVGHGRRFLGGSNPVVDAVLGGWQVSAINTAQSGTPFNLTYTPNSKNAVSPQISATYRGANEYRPNAVAGVPKISKSTLSNGYIQWVNYGAFTLPATGSLPNYNSPFGNSGRNPGRSPIYNDADLALNKRFQLPIETMKIEFRSELYNVFNHTNFYLPSSGLSGTLGSTPTSGGTITSTFEPRIIQFGLKVIY